MGAVAEKWRCVSAAENGRSVVHQNEAQHFDHRSPCFAHNAKATVVEQSTQRTEDVARMTYALLHAHQVAQERSSLILE